MEESPEGLAPNLARRAKAAVVGQLYEQERQALQTAVKLKHLAQALEDDSPKETASIDQHLLKLENDDAHVRQADQ